MSVNPVLRRELLERWRGRRAFVVVTVYVAALAVVTQLLYWVGRAQLDDRFGFGGFVDMAGGPALGRFLFENLLGLVLLLVLFIGPGYAAAQISGERERRTLALLQVTLVRPWQIVTGKLGASVAWLLLLVVAALPFAAMAFFVGGVAVPDLMRTSAMVVGLTVAMAGIGLGVSSLTRRTTASVVVTYAVVLALTLGTLFAAIIEGAMKEFDPSSDRLVSLYLNPFYGLADAAHVDAFSDVGPSLPSVLSPFGSVLSERIGPQPPPRIVIDREFGAGPATGEFEFPADRPGGGEREPVWLLVLGAYLAMGAVGSAVATYRVRIGAGPLRRRRPGPTGGDSATAGSPGEPAP